jgi:hypothetical protein
MWMPAIGKIVEEPKLISWNELDEHMWKTFFGVTLKENMKRTNSINNTEGVCSREGLLISYCQGYIYEDEDY